MDYFVTYKEKPFIVDGVEMSIHCETREIYNETHLAYPHYHKYIELLYAVDCHTTATLNTSNYSFNTGDLLIIFPDEVHSMYALKSYNKYYVIKFLPSTLQWGGQLNPMESKYLAPLHEDSNNEYKRRFSKEEIENTNAQEIIISIINEWINQKYGYELAIHSGVIDLYLWIIRQWMPVNKTGDKTNPLPENLTRIMNMACKHIQTNYSTVTANELCEIFNYSYSYFLNNFKLYTGQNFSEYVLNIKLLNAVNILLSTDKSITEIANETGFSTTSYFILNFKKKYNMSPSAYRKSQKNNFDLKNSTVEFESTN